MQALQFLKGPSALPAQKETGDLLNKKESGVPSFKSMLEDASRKTESSGEIKKEDAPKGESRPVLVKSEKQAEKESEPQENILAKGEKECAVFAELAVETGEVVLFGQPVEQLADAPVLMDAETAPLEDVTATQAVFEPGLPSEEIQLVSAESPAVQISSDSLRQITLASGPVPAPFSAYGIESDIDSVEPVPVADGEDSFAQALAVDIQPLGGIPEKQEADGLGDMRMSPYGETDSQKNPARELTAQEANPEGRFTIVDNRSTDAKKAALKAAPEKAVPAVELKAESVRQSGNTLDITFNLNQEQGQVLAAEQNMLSSSDQVAAGDSSNFQRMLSNQLQAQAPEFVKAGSIILRDNDNGTINLNLKPESLGNVKITLHVSDKGIEGQIVVASKEAFEAFNQNMDNLRQSFRQSGFDAANLSLSLSDGSSAQGQLAQGNAGNHQRSGEDFNGSRTFGGWTDGEEKLPSQTIAAAYGAGGHQIDVVA